MRKTTIAFLLLAFTFTAHKVSCSEEATLNREALECPYVYHTVNVITGEYCENETDLHLTGPLSFSLKRCYSSQDPFAQGWYFNQPNFLLSEEDTPKEMDEGTTHYEFDEEKRIKTITLNSTKEDKVHHRLDFHYKEDDFTECDVSSDDGQSAHYTFSKVEPSRSIHPYLLERVTTSNGKEISYQYVDHPNERKKVISQREEQDGRYLSTEYYDSLENDVGGTLVTITDPIRDPRVGRVKLQKAPAGVDNTPTITSRFFYEPGHTTVYDALNNKTVYRYGNNSKLTSIENYLEEDSLYRIERFHWDNKEQLTSRSIEDANGTVYSCQTFQHDIRGNVLKQTLYGDLTGTQNTPLSLDEDGLPLDKGVESYSTICRYSEDEKHQLLYQAGGKGDLTRYQYLPDSDLIESIFTYDHTSLKIRQFYCYDDFDHLVEIIVDDGVSEDPNNLEGVTERKLTSFTPREEAPGLGMPEIVEEKFLDLTTGSEELIKRAVITYSKKNEVLQRDIYDNCGDFKHSLINEYDEKGNLIQTTDTEGNLKEASYDAHGNQLKISTNDSHIDNEYDFSNRLIHSEEEPSEEGPRKQTTFRYDTAGNRIASIDLFGNETLWEYDALGRAIKSTLPSIKGAKGNAIQPTVQQEYDILDNIISCTDANGNTTKTSYNARGKPTKIIHPDGSQESFEYNLDGSERKTVAKNGTSTIYTRDFLSRITQEDFYNSEGQLLGTKTNTYSAFHLLSETDHGGRTTTYLYDGAGRQVSIKKNTDKGTTRTEIGYDSMGQVQERRGWFGKGDNEFSNATVVRDSKNRISDMSVQNAWGEILKKTTVDLEESVDTNNPSTSYNYDHYNDLEQNVLQVTTADTEGNTTTTTFNALNKPEKVEKKNTFNETISSKEIFYDPVGNKVREAFQVIGADRTYVNEWSYGPNHRLESVTEAAETAQAKTTTYTYYPDGSLENIIKPDGVTLTHKYTPAGKIARFFSSDKTIDYAYTYDVLDRAIQIEDRTHKTMTVRLYDENDNVTHEQLANGLTVENRYDLLGRRTELILPDNSSISYSYNAAFLTAIERRSVDGEPLYHHNYTQYSLSGRPTETDGIGNSGKTSYTYDEKDRLTSIQHPHWSETLSHNATGQIISLTLNDPAGTITNTYQYGDQQQLIQETGVNDSSYEYDSIFNRIKKEDAPYHIDNLNQLTDTGESAFAYDANGNRLEAKSNDPLPKGRGVSWKGFRTPPNSSELNNPSLKEGVFSNFDNTLTCYKYDALNRISQISQSRSFKLTFTYDSFHRRLSKTTYKWNTTKNCWESGNTLHYIYDGENEIGAVNADGTVKELRVLGVGLGAEIGAAVAIELEGSTYAPIHDHRGSVCCLVDASSGQPIQGYRYSAFGVEQVFSSQKELVNNPWRFSSKRTDEETNLVFFGKRYYEASIGRWLTKDPLGTPDGINRYAFVQNQPMNKIDLYGLFSFSNTWSWMRSAYQFMNTNVNNLANHLSFTNYIKPTLDLIIPKLFGQPILYLAGYYKDKSETGVHGKGELHDKVRITLINGIMNARIHYKSTLDAISNSHGGVNIHYIFDASDGWTKDLLKAFLAKIGITSPHAYQLADTWRTLISEMDGVDGGGTIIHYAHSIGGTHTKAALELLTPEERKMIHVYTFGSASMIYDSGLETVVNYISVRDGIVLCDPIGFISGLFGLCDEVQTVGSWFGIPLIDHMIETSTYIQIFHILGRQFLQLYVAREGL